MDADTALLEFLQYSLGHLATRPSETLIRCEHRENGELVYRVTVHPDDAGRVIGREGRTVSSIRGVLGAAAEKHGVKALLKVYSADGEDLVPMDSESRDA